MPLLAIRSLMPQDSPYRKCADEVEALTKKLMQEVPAIDITQARKEAMAKAKEEGQTAPPPDSPKSPSSEGALFPCYCCVLTNARRRRTTKEEVESSHAWWEEGGRKSSSEQGEFRSCP